MHIRRLSYLLLEEHSLISINIDKLVELLHIELIQYLVSEFHTFGKHLDILHQDFFQNVVMGPDNSFLMLKKMKSLDPQFQELVIHEFVENQFKNDEKTEVKNLKYFFYLLIPKIKNDFHTFFELKNDTSSDFYVASVDESNDCCNCYVICESLENLKKTLEKKNKLLIQIVGCSKKEGLNQEHTLKYFSKLFEYLKGKEIELQLIGPDLPNELDTI
eukprot:gene3127-5297_t